MLSGEAEKGSIPEDALDAQQAMVGELLLPYAERLDQADIKMKELPLALYDAQTNLMNQIVAQSAGAVQPGRRLPEHPC